MKVDFEDRLLSTIKTVDDLAVLEENNIVSEAFILRKDIYEFIQNYNLKYGDIPTKQVLESTFEDFKVVDHISLEERKFLIDEVTKNYVRSKTIKIINKASELIPEDPEGAVDFIVSKLSSIKSKNKVSKSFTDADALNRLAKVDERKETVASGKTKGIKTGLSIFDSTLLGWQPGNLISLVGRLGQGKSWVAEYMSCMGYIDGARLAYISPEMSISEVEDRWDTIISSIQGEVFQNDSLALGSVNKAKYERFLQRISSRRDWVTLTSNNGCSFTISSIQSIVDAFKPNMICIDGFQLIEDEMHSQESWQATKNVAYGLKAIAQNNGIVVLVTAQANRNAANDMPDISEVYGGDALMQASDVAIMIASDPEQPMKRFITVPKVRSRRTWTSKIPISFDVNNGKIGI